MVCIYCDTLYPAGILVCEECNDYTGLIRVDEREGK
jgi:hypothetical protein